MCGKALPFRICVQILIIALTRLSLVKAIQDSFDLTEGQRPSAHQAAEPQYSANSAYLKLPARYRERCCIRSWIFGRLAITVSPTIFKLFGEILSSVSSFVCQYGYVAS